MDEPNGHRNTMKKKHLSDDARVRINLNKNQYIPITPLPDKPDGKIRMPESPESPGDEETTLKSVSSGDAQQQKPTKTNARKRRVSSGSIRKIEYWLVSSNDETKKRKVEPDVVVLDGAGDQLLSTPPSPEIEIVPLPYCNPESQEIIPLSCCKAESQEIVPSSYCNIESQETVPLSYCNPDELWKETRKLRKTSKANSLVASRVQVRDKSFPWSVVIQPLRLDDCRWNQSILKKICHWLKDWKKPQQLVQGSISNEKNPRKKSKKKRADESESGEDIDGDVDFVLSRMQMVETYDNPLCIVGANGSGKTTLVNVATVSENYTVIAQGSDSERNQQNLLKLKEATCSRRMATDIRNLFGAPKASIENIANKISKKEFTALVFEDVDHEEDLTFWNALNHLLTDSKIPIIITCSEKSIIEGRFEKPLIIELPKPDINEQAAYLKECLLGLICVRIPKNFVLDCLKAFDGDFRRCTNQLQLALAGRPISVTLKDVTGSYGNELPNLESQELNLKFSHPWEPKRTTVVVDSNGSEETESRTRRSCRTRDPLM